MDRSSPFQVLKKFSDVRNKKSKMKKFPQKRVFRFEIGKQEKNIFACLENKI